MEISSKKKGLDEVIRWIDDPLVGSMVCHNDVASVFQGLRWNGKVLEEAHSV
jgi:hypothetical protein